MFVVCSEKEGFEIIMEHEVFMKQIIMDHGIITELEIITKQ